MHATTEKKTTPSEYPLVAQTGKTLRETLVRRVAADCGINMVDVSLQLGYKAPSGLYYALKSRRPRYANLAAVARWLTEHGCRVTPSQLSPPR